MPLDDKAIGEMKDFVDEVDELIAVVDDNGVDACIDGFDSEVQLRIGAQRSGPGLDPAVLRGAIHWHHKVLPYRGPHERIIEACRKADWIDASKGLVRKGVSRAAIKDVGAAFPNRGFHAGGWKVKRGIV